MTGRITEIRFKDGQEVKAGDVLFVIDPRPYQAAVAKAAGTWPALLTMPSWPRSSAIEATG